MPLTEQQKRALNTARWVLGRDTRDADAPAQTRIDRLRDALEMAIAAFAEEERPRLRETGDDDEEPEPHGYCQICLGPLRPDGSHISTLTGVRIPARPELVTS